MEGIAGTFGAEDKSLVRSMLGKLEHRGPDIRDVHGADDAMIGAVAKTLSSGRTADAVAEADGVAVASDSYLFNKSRLKEAFAHDAQADISDQELLLAMYSELGHDMFGHIDGGYAVAVVDDNGVVIARDGYGLKPLYLSGNAEEGIFSSEMKSQMLVEEEFSPFPPGKVLVMGKGLRPIRTEDVRPERHVDGQCVVKALRQALEESARQALDGGDGFNILLSGGVDSSAIAAAASEVTDDLSTVCVGYEGGIDPGMARKVSDELGTDHHEKTYDIDDMLGVLDDAIYAAETFDFPLVRSCIPNYMATRQFEDISKVTLCGEGGDEVFAGYNYMRDIRSDDELRREREHLLKTGHMTGFQRVDRMTSAASLDGRMPFMSKDVVDIGLSMDRVAVLGPSINESKLALRKAFADKLPDEVVWRKKLRFSDGAGSIKALVEVAEKAISDSEFERERKTLPKGRIRTKEELLYYRSFARHFDSDSAARAVGFTPRP